MKLLISVLSLAAACIARPDIGLDLRNAGHYHDPNQPLPNIPSGSYLPVSPNLPVSPFNGGSINTKYTVVGGGALNENRHGDFTSFLTPSLVSGKRVIPFAGGSSVSSTSSFGGGSVVTGTGYAPDFGDHQAQIQKHVYFFSAPDEPEPPRPRLPLPVAPPKKNVKILFIKTPSFPAPPPVQLPVQPQNEEKTVIYVLVKKPEEQTVELPPQPLPTPPSKPEVYFIKYKTQKEAEHVVSNLESGAGGSIGGGVSGIAESHGSKNEFVNTIVDSAKFDTRHGEGGGLISSNIYESSTFGGVGGGGVVSSTTPSTILVGGGAGISSTTLQTPIFGPVGESGPY